jgi:hypothetical protein
VLARQVLYHMNHVPQPFLLQFIFQLGSQVFAW